MVTECKVIFFNKMVLVFLLIIVLSLHTMH